MNQGKCGQASFAAGYHFYKMFWIFLSSSVAGCIIETVFAYLRYGDYESRVGLIYGPFSQVYGFTAVVMVLILHRLGVKPWYFLFLSSAIIGAILEFMFSLAQENLFGSISWDYSAHPLNVLGRTSLIYSVYWGILGVFLIKLFYPVISSLVERLPIRRGLALTWILILLLFLDIAVSAGAVYREHQRHHDIPATNAIQILLDHKYPDSFLQKKYPNLIHI